MFDKLVRNSQSADMARVQSGIGCSFQYSRAEPAHQCCFFDCHDKFAIANRPQHNVLVERLYETRVHDTDVEAFLAQQLGSFQTFTQQCTAAYYCALVTPRKDLAFSQLD